MAACAPKIIVKLSYNEETRRYTVDASALGKYEAVYATTAEMFGLTAHPFKFTYVDPEGDRITITTDAELAEAVSLAAAASPPILRLSVLLTNKTKSDEGSLPAEPNKKPKTDGGAPAPPADLAGLINHISESLPQLVGQLPASVQALLPNATIDVPATLAATAAAAADASLAAAASAAAAVGGPPPPDMGYGDDGVHPGVTCDKTGQCPIVGNRYNLRGHDWDLCEAEFLKLPAAEQACYDKIAPPIWHPRNQRRAHRAAAAAAAAADVALHPDPEKGFHPGVSCDRSGMCPIVGVRYNLAGHNYDLCQAEYDKLSDAEKARYKKIPPRCHPGRGGGFRCGGGMGASWGAGGGPGPMAGGRPFRGGGGGGHCGGGGGGCGGGEPPKFAARFVRDVSIFDGTQMAPATKFTKIWRLKNAGETPWPAGAKLMFVGGDSMASPPFVSASVDGHGQASVMPGQEIDISVDLVAPDEVGRYVGYWRLAGPHGRRKFGQRIWAHIQVVEPGAAVEAPSEVELAEAVAKAKQMETDAADDDNEVDDAEADGAAAVSSAAPLPVPMDDGTPVPAWPGNDAASDGSFCAVEADEAVEAADKMTTDKTVAVDNAHATALAYVAAAAAASPASDADKAAEAVAAELASMGFTDEPVVRFVIDRNHAELEACARELATLSEPEWEASVADLVEMGFDDVALNKRVLLKHGGSVKAAVKELVAAGRAA